MTSTYSGPPRAITAGGGRFPAFAPGATGNDVVTAALADLRRRQRRRRLALQVARLAAGLAIVALWQVCAMLIKDAFYWPAPVHVGHPLAQPHRAPVRGADGGIQWGVCRGYR